MGRWELDSNTRCLPQSTTIPIGLHTIRGANNHDAKGHNPGRETAGYSHANMAFLANNCGGWTTRVSAHVQEGDPDASGFPSSHAAVEAFGISPLDHGCDLDGTDVGLAAGVVPDWLCAHYVGAAAVVFEDAADLRKRKRQSPSTPR